MDEDRARTGTRSPVESLRLTVAARRHYLDGASKSTIAAELGVSRFKVARLLEQARRTGLVSIEVAAPADVDVDVSLALAARFGLRQALAVRVAGDEDERRHALAAAAAAALGDVVEEGDVLGVAWGRTLREMVRALPALPADEVVQVVGAPPGGLEHGSLDLARGVAERAGARLHPLHVPLVVDDPRTARLLRAEAQVAATTAWYPRLTRAVVGIGSWRGDGSSLRRVLPDDLRTALESAGAVADLCATVLDRDGRELTAGGLARRTLAITTEELRSVPDVVAVAAGAGRAGAVAAALRSGLVHRLVVDAGTAEEVLAAADPGDPETGARSGGAGLS